MDLYPGRDMYDSFCNYQQALLAEFDRLCEEYKFEIVDAANQPRVVFAHLKASILRLLDRDSRDSYLANLATSRSDSADAPIRTIVEPPVLPFRDATKTFLNLAANPVVAQSPNGNGAHHHE